MKKKISRDDGYGTMMREKLKESMSEPWKPYNRKEPDATPPWWIVFYLIAGLVLFAMAWLAVDRLEQVFR